MNIKRFISTMFAVNSHKPWNFRLFNNWVNIATFENQIITMLMNINYEKYILSIIVNTKIGLESKRTI